MPRADVGAIGDGGMVVTNDPSLAQQVRLLREYGWQERYLSYFAGTNSRLDELQAPSCASNSSIRIRTTVAASRSRD